MVKYNFLSLKLVKNPFVILFYLKVILDDGDIHLNFNLTLGQDLLVDSGPSYLKSGDKYLEG